MTLRASAELQFVMRAADPRCTATELVTIARGTEDWQRVAVLTEAEGATGVLWRLLRADAAQLPAEFMAFLHARTMLADFRMQRLAARAAETVAALLAADIPVVFLKGAAVGAHFDATFRQRPMTDLDLLIRPADAERAQACVQACGWQEMAEPRFRELLQGYQHLPPFIDPTLEGLRLELHTRLLPPDSSFGITAETLWDTAVPCAAPFVGARTPELAHLLVHTAVHYAWQHALHFGAWRTFRSVGLIVRAPDWHWDPLVALARATKAHTSCYWTLRLAQGLSGIPVPESVLAALAPPTPEPVRRMLDRHFLGLVDPTEHPPSPSDGLSSVLWRMALRPKWSGHTSVSRVDPERRWERAFATEAPLEGGARVRRHFAARQAWWKFLTRTIGGR